jgi:UDP-N-acetylglucosamine acyltransferase
VIDPRAVVDPGARLAEDVAVGAFAVVGPDVEIGPGTWIGPHTVVQGPTRIGRDNRIYQFASVGEAPQDKKYAGEPTWLEIGDGNVIREFCTINRGTAQDLGVTRIGDRNWIMAYVHIAHDCEVGDDTVFANGATLAGHVTVESHAILGGFTLVHQFCRIGAHAFCGMGSAVGQDVPTYMMVNGSPARPRGINVEGLRRRGFDADSIARLRHAYRTLYRSSLRFEDALGRLEEQATVHADVAELTRFLRASRRSIVR